MLLSADISWQCCQVFNSSKRSDFQITFFISRGFQLNYQSNRSRDFKFRYFTEVLPGLQLFEIIRFLKSRLQKGLNRFLVPFELKFFQKVEFHSLTLKFGSIASRYHRKLRAISGTWENHCFFVILVLLSHLRSDGLCLKNLHCREFYQIFKYCFFKVGHILKNLKIDFYFWNVKTLAKNKLPSLA